MLSIVRPLRGPYVGGALACAATGLTSTPCAAEALLVIEPRGQGCSRRTRPIGIPPSVTKLRPAYVTLRSVGHARLASTTPPSRLLGERAWRERAREDWLSRRQKPSSPVDNRAQMLIGEVPGNGPGGRARRGVAGSIEEFRRSDETPMRGASADAIDFVNPLTALPSDDQIVSAR